MSDKTMKMGVSKMGVTIGTYWGVNLFLLAVMAMFFGVGGTVVSMFGTFYVGYTATFLGAILGLVLGFIHGYVVGVVGNVVVKFINR